MKIRSHEFVAELPPLETSSLELSAELHQHDDGRMHIYFADETIAPYLCYDYTRVGYREFDHESMMLGLRVASGLRGRDLGISMVEYLQEHIADCGQGFMGTGYIYKPLVALTLKRAGLEPVSDEVLVEILPWAKGDDTGTPKIQVLKNESEQELSGLARPSGGQFYEVVPQEEVVARYPINSPEMIVALHTKYQPASILH